MPSVVDDIIAINEMIDASVNHPCIIIQAFYNEGPSNNPLACPGTHGMTSFQSSHNEGSETSASTIRSRVANGNPPSRLVTWANNQLTHDACIYVEDIISFNAYPAWYVQGETRN